ncbi:M16 family metallopeptidase [Hyphobacterium marinum]|uniref:Pitrilysin family protein n=1 Tax=Hyphobacterium marinum TaxID=3116574 RepID=A0ABU7LYA7_9PROT|nr:pitrilysin family protein [Hyphobacterium sp. Y6023]MEE2565995.1 pitrilysin family protein [Hyphobacterium sp. Y6023]
MMKWLLALAGALALAACGENSSGELVEAVDPNGDDGSTTREQGIQVDVRYETLDNGLRVVMSRDTSVPTATVAVYYGVGFRVEPQGRTGFAHLFEHLMFEGSENLPGGTMTNLIYNAGGVQNGSTRYDFTNYFEVVPNNALEAIIWAEADRMARPIIDQENLDAQRGVVRNEVFVNVINQPYGGWIWIDLPMLANENWHNAHNFYGDLADLDAASLEDVQSFFDTYYSVNNAVIAVVGDIEYDETMAWIVEHFGTIEPGPALPPLDISEPRQTEEKFGTIDDPLAPQPALGFAYHMPERGSPEYYAMAVLDQLLVQGDDSLLNQRLINEEGYASGVFGGINLLGNMYNYNGPMLWSVGMIHDAQYDRDTIMATVDEVIEQLRTEEITQEQLDRSITKLRSQFYGIVDSGTRFGLIDLLASFALFDDDPSRINRIEAGFDQVTPELVLATAQEYLRPTNRSVLVVRPVEDDADETETE